jgi:hypothetical protein
METVWELSWRIYPAAALMAVGLALAARGDFLLVRAARKPVGAPRKNYTWMSGFRLALFGGSLAAVGAGWLWDIPALAVAGLAIGFEETIETSICAHALKEAGD